MTPSPPAQAQASETPEQIAESLLPCRSVRNPHVINCAWNTDGDNQPVLDHDGLCPAHHRPAVSAALQSERDSRDRRIAELESALKPFAVEADKWDDIFDHAADTYPIKAHRLTVGQLRKARSALTAGEKS